MFEVERIIALGSITWAVIVLLLQWATPWVGRRKDFSVKAGSPLRGVIYNFTWAMLPSHKETIRLHPIKFSIGFMMHIGALLAILRILLLLINPRMVIFSPVVWGVIFGISALCGIYLFLRRVFSPALRLMSSPDDYLSILLTIGFLLMGIAHASGIITSGSFLVYAAVLFFYMPFGKLKHALFFFIARAEYGARMGYRGTYPAGSGMKE
jgi:nitrate reductase gamma subunit